MKVEEVNDTRRIDPRQSPLSQPSTSSDLAEHVYRSKRVTHWDAVARWRDSGGGLGGAYQRQLEEVFKYLVPADSSVLELGCGRGDLLAALRPRRGVGVDFSAEMVKRAWQRHPELDILLMDAQALELDEQFDFIILSDLVNDLWDAQKVFEQISRLATPRSRLILNFYNRLWEGPLSIARRLGLA